MLWVLREIVQDVDDQINIDIADWTSMLESGDYVQFRHCELGDRKDLRRPPPPDSKFVLAGTSFLVGVILALMAFTLWRLRRARTHATIPRQIAFGYYGHRIAFEPDFDNAYKCTLPEYPSRGVHRKHLQRHLQDLHPELRVTEISDPPSNERAHGTTAKAEVNV
jgi:uncharacterized protein (UPF0212 family)